MIEQQYTQEEKHAAVEQTIANGWSTREAARETGISRSHLQRWIAEAREEPERKLAEARVEAEHRRRVLALVHGLAGISRANR